MIQLVRINPAAEKPANDKARLINLQKALVEALQSQLGGLHARFHAGKDPLIVILEASDRRHPGADEQ